MEEFNNKKMLSESAALKDQKITWILQAYIHTYAHISMDMTLSAHYLS